MSHVRIGVAIVCSDGRVVVGFRKNDPGYGGRLEFPGGKVRPGESPEACAERETWEEAGMRVRAVGRLARGWRQRGDEKLEIFFVACQPTTDLPPLPPFLWIPCQALDPDDFPPVNRPIVEWLKEAVQG